MVSSFAEQRDPLVEEHRCHIAQTHKAHYWHHDHPFSVEWLRPNPESLRGWCPGTPELTRRDTHGASTTAPGIE